MTNYLDENGITQMSYRDTAVLESFLTEHGRIQHRRDTGLSSKQQHQLKKAVKRARFMGLLPYTRA